MTSQRTAALIVNPAAGRAARFRSQLQDLTALLGAHGYGVQVLETSAKFHSGRDLALQSLASDLVLACGGDGTVHDVAQGLAHTRIPLGILPLGTANALARNLGLPLEPLAALGRLLTYRARSISLGEIVTPATTRCFILMAGCGPDGALVESLPAAQKSRFGRTAYYAHAARLFATRRWPTFQVDYRVVGDLDWKRTLAVGMLCTRAPDLGGLFSGLTPHSRLDDDSLHVHLLAAPAQLSFTAWFTATRLGLRNPWLTTVNVEELHCKPLTDGPIHAQADAEACGPIPLSLRILPSALSLLMP